MAVSRRTVLTTAVAGSALAAVGGAQLVNALHAEAASPPGDVVGKITVGYQGWFACTGDGSPLNGYWHWSQNWGQQPSPSNTAIISWPDMREYINSYPTAYANLGNGQPARLFSQYDQQTVDTHFRWMQQFGCDTAALQRFNPTGGEGPIRDAMAVKVRQAAEAFGRKFYIMYDVTNWTNMQSQIKTDWTNKMRAYTSSPAYAIQNGRPVVCIWGFGFNDPGRPFAPAACLDVVNWFKAQGCYVIGGVPTWWRTGVSDSRSGFIDVYNAFNMISPWMVGRTGDLAGLDSYYNNVNLGDQAHCNARGIDYQPCVMPGDLSSGHRRHGDFYWRHFYNMCRLGSQGIYISMFDEYNEGNQIAKTAENASMQPTNFGRRALDEDGVACSSDYYLRITADGGRMFKGQLALTATRPTQPIAGGQPPTQPPPVGVVALRSRANSRYVCAENAGAAALIANRTAIGLWEQFEVVTVAGGNVALRARVNNQFVSAQNAGAAPLLANRASAGSSETFQLVRNSDGTVSFRATVNNRYVCAENAGAAALIANRTAIGPWEQFDMVPI
jgi:hypothetical protein